MNRPAAEAFIFSWLLPALLWALTFLLAGFHYETNDDLLMSFIARGLAFGKPVGDYGIYFHGFGQLFVWLYQQFPAVPWYGFILYALLFLATSLAYKFLYKVLRPRCSFITLIGTDILFYLANWYEHAFWFNYMRVPLLLAALSLLNAFPSNGQNQKINWLNVAGLSFLFLLALAIRPGAALLGVTVVFPYLLFQWLRYKERQMKFLKTVAIFTVSGILFTGWLQLHATKAAAQYRHVDTLKSAMVDFQWCCGSQQTSEENLILDGMHHWFVADVAVWQPLLKKLHPDWPYLLQEAFFVKLPAALQALVLDQFLALALVVFLLSIHYKNRRQLNWKYVVLLQGYTALLLLAFALALKLPPRVLTPVLGLHLLITLAFLPPKLESFKPVSGLFKGVLLLLLGLQFYKISSRALWQNGQQQKAEQYFETLSSGYQQRLIILADVSGELRALSPFLNYTFGDNQVLFLTGWQTLDPHFLPYLQQLSGKTGVGEALQELSNRKNVIWVMQPQFKTFLSSYLNHFYGQAAEINSLQPVAQMPNPDTKIYELRK